MSAFARVSSLPIPDPDPEPDSWEAFADYSPRGGAAGGSLSEDEEEREGAATLNPEGARGDVAVGAADAAEDTGASLHGSMDPCAACRLSNWALSSFWSVVSERRVLPFACVCVCRACIRALAAEAWLTPCF